MSNYLCEIMIGHKMNIGEQHEENTGCISDFLWDKKGIDVGMRAAFLCDNCISHSTGNPYLESKEFADTISILNAISYASRRGADILSELPRTGSAELNISDGKAFDAFLCHNSQDKQAVRRLNEALINGGVRTWLDVDQVMLGDVWQDRLEAAIQNIATCLVIVGDSGFGPWQDQELRAFIGEFVNRGCRIIPVLVGKPAKLPELPLFLKQFMWSDLRKDDGRQVAKIISVLRGPGRAR